MIIVITKKNMENSIGQVKTGAERFSAQREAIYETLQNTKEHPDADAIAAAVREKMPDVGVATVYRNLKKLVSCGLVHTVETTDNRIHYDADTRRHAHFICKHCGKISDLFVATSLEHEVEKMGYSVDSEKLVLYGVCPECSKKR